MVLQVDHGFLAREPGLVVMNSLARVEGKKWFPIAIVNSSNKAFNIKTGNVVARVGSIEETSVCSVAEAYAGLEEGPIETELSVPAEYRDSIDELIGANADLFASKDTELGQTDIIHMRIDTGGQPPIRLYSNHIL